MPLSWSKARRLSPRPAEPKTTTAKGQGGGPWPSAARRATASSAARRVEGADLAPDDGADGAPLEPAIEEDADDGGQRRKGAPELRHVARSLDGVAERDGAGEARAHQVAHRQRAGDPAECVDDAEMADGETVHAADRAVQEGVGRDGLERAACPGGDGRREGVRAACGERLHDVALGEDAERRGRVVRPADEEGADALPRHAGDGLSERRLGSGEGRARAHRIADAAAEQKRIEVAQARLDLGHAGVAVGLGPDGGGDAGWPVVLPLHRADGVGERAHAGLLEQGDERAEDARAALRVAQRAVPVAGLDAEGAGEDLEGKDGQAGQHELARLRVSSA